MRKLKDLLFGVSLKAVSGSTAEEVRELCFDSRKVASKDVFIAIRGTETDGHRFIEKAIEQGATAIICESLPDSLRDGVTYMEVADSQQALAIMAANFYENPSRNLQLVG
ncbi:MAG: Mur ligase domain-containing protein, partial [Robiginitalea sp.]